MRSIERHVHFPEAQRQTLQAKGEKYSRRVASIISKCDYTKPESALAIAGDAEYQAAIEEQIKHLRGSKRVVLVGIGGSSLGTEAVYQALAFKTNPKLLVLDTIENSALERLSAFLEGAKWEEIAILIVSKSGTTIETMANGVQVLDFCEQRFGTLAAERIAFIGAPDTDFMQIGQKKKVTCVTFPESISGRYSVFSAVGIVPLLILGIDTVSFREGATEAVSKKGRSEIIEHTAALAALAQAGVHTVNFFTFNERLQTLGFWYRQLLAESIGKNMTTKGTTFCHQLLPTVSTSVDLHSMAQLYLGGYAGMYTHFVFAHTECEHHALTDHWLLEHVDVLRKKTPERIQHALRQGVISAYDDQKLPYRFTELDKLTAYEMGLTMSALLFETMALGALLDIDAFDQPNVELYKTHAKAALTT